MSALEHNIEKLNGHLARFRRNGILHRIAGEDHSGGGGVFETLSPVDKSTICQVARGDAGDIDRAAKAAKAAFPAWRDMPAKKRRAILIKIAEGIEARAEGIALCECWDHGQDRRLQSTEIRRASWRGRVEISGGDGA